MKNTIFILAMAYISVFFTATVDLFHDIVGAQFNLLPALMVYTSLTNGFASIMALALCGGLCFDSLSLNPLGVTVLPLMLVGLAIWYLRDLLLRDHVYAQTIVGATAGTVIPLITLFLLMNSGHSPVLGLSTVWQILVETVTTALLTPLCFYFFDRLHRAFDYQPWSQPSFRPDREIKRGPM